MGTMVREISLKNAMLYGVRDHSQCESSPHLKSHVTVPILLSSTVSVNVKFHWER